MKTVLITGANKGIGLETTKVLLASGFRVIALSRHVDNLKNIETANLLIYQVDLLQQADLLKVLSEIKIKSGRIDILINNAGIGLFKRIEDCTIEEWNSVIQLNLTVPFILINQLLPDMILNQYGRIINIGSDADSLPFPNAGVYCATKYGLRGMTESIRLDIKNTNVNISTISPGRVDTYFNKKKPGCRPNALKVSDVAKQILFILQQEDRCNIEQIKLTSALE